MKIYTPIENLAYDDFKENVESAKIYKNGILTDEYFYDFRGQRVQWKSYKDGNLFFDRLVGTKYSDIYEYEFYGENGNAIGSQFMTLDDNGRVFEVERGCNKGTQLFMDVFNTDKHFVSYDDYGRVRAVRDEFGLSYTYEFDRHGNVIVENIIRLNHNCRDYEKFVVKKSSRDANTITTETIDLISNTKLVQYETKNDHGHITSCIIEDEQGKVSERTYEYIYDNYRNWIWRRTKSNDNNVLEEARREIKYIEYSQSKAFNNCDSILAQRDQLWKYYEKLGLELDLLKSIRNSTPEILDLIEARELQAQEILTVTDLLHEVPFNYYKFNHLVSDLFDKEEDLDDLPFDTMNEREERHANDNPWIDVFGDNDEAETAYWNTD